MASGHSNHGFLDTGDHSMRNRTLPKFGSNSEQIHFTGSDLSHQFHSYLFVYSLLVIGSILVSNISSLVYIFGSIRASKKISALLVESILGSTLRWALPSGVAFFNMLWTLKIQMARWDTNIKDDSQMHSRYTRCRRPDSASIYYSDLYLCHDA